MKQPETSDIARRMAEMEKNFAELEKKMALQAQQIKDLLAMVAPVKPQQTSSILQQALVLLREGKRTESIALVKAHGKRKTA